jgi:hypothetical protein
MVIWQETREMPVALLRCPHYSSISSFVCVALASFLSFALQTLCHELSAKTQPQVLRQLHVLVALVKHN